jgi:hypothetical protein
MRRVLVVAYYFPPSGGPGVQRILKFIKYLPEFGWEPVVLTVREDAEFPARDESLLDEIPSGIKIHRTKIFEPYRFYRIFTGKSRDVPIDVETLTDKGKRGIAEKISEFIRATFFIPDARIGWFPYAVPIAVDIVKNENIDLIFSSSPPYTCSVIARQVKLKTGKLWVADFRDPWTDFLSTPRRWFFPKMVDRYLEFSCFRDADAVTVAVRGIIEDVRGKYPELPICKFFHIPNGFDPADYPSDKFKGRSDKFTVTYTGSMYGKRNPRSFLRAVEELVNEGKVSPEKVRIVFVGRLGSDVIDTIESSGIRSLIEIHPYVSHRDSIKFLIKSDVLLLIIDEDRAGGIIVTGKVYEYFGARRPIIAIAPEGELANLIRWARVGKVAKNGDIEGIKRIFLEYYNGYLSGKVNFNPDEREIAKYNRRECTRKLSEIFNKVTTGEIC